MKNKLRTILFCLLMLIFLNNSIIFAYDNLYVDNTIGTSVIDIELSEYSKLEDDTLVPWEDNIVILPGVEFSKIPRIKNIGDNCYIRAKLSFSKENLGITYLDIGYNWIQCKDGYWYYTEVLKTNSYTDIFQGLKIPDDLSQDLEEETIQLKIDVDAIQVNNFIPDYDSDKPWGDIKIQYCIHDGSYTLQELESQSPKSFEIQYDRGSSSLIKNEDDFFQNIPTLVPGDMFTDTLKLSNDSDENINLYFSTFSVDSELLDNINLKIVLKEDDNEELIYEGKLSSDKLEKEFLLASINVKDNRDLVYTLKVPKELDNQYTLLEDKVRWMFRVESLDNENVVSSFTGDKDIIHLVLILVSGFLMLKLRIKHGVD